jgi:hypothetical protein
MTAAEGSMDWVLRKMPRRNGLPRDHWVPKRRRTNAVMVIPPSGGYPDWVVSVDDLELLELRGPNAMELAFFTGAAFARLKVRLRRVLGVQGYVRRPRRRRPRRAR